MTKNEIKNYICLILTIGNVQKRRISVIDWYCMCEKSGETVDHLQIARELWIMVFGLFGIQWVS